MRPNQIKSVHFGPGRQQTKYMLRINQQEIISTYRYLRVLFQQNLNFVQTAKNCPKTQGMTPKTIINKVLHVKLITLDMRHIRY